MTRLTYSACSIFWTIWSVSATIHHESGSTSALSGDFARPFGIVDRSVPANTPLHICCIGDSITVGVGDGYPTGSGQNNGYRLDLYNMLTSAGLDPQFVGSQTSGTDNPQPNHEGYGAQTISSILGQLQNIPVLEQHPTLVLIHAGTNDMNFPANDTSPDTSLAEAPSRLGKLIDYVNCIAPDAIVLVAQIIQNKAWNDGVGQANTNLFNSKVPDIVGERYMRGFKVRVVDMSMIGGLELSDWLHPKPGGYFDMANRWYSAIQDIPTEWWSTAKTPQSNTTNEIQTCARDAISFSAAINGKYLTNGFHVTGDTADPPVPTEHNGTMWTPHWDDAGIIAIGSGHDGSGVQFPDLNGDGRPDYIWVDYNNSGAVYAWLNGGVDVWNAVNNAESIFFGTPNATYVEFADLDGDRLPDLIINVDGQFKIWRNGGADGTIWSWSEMTTTESGLNQIFAGAAPYHWFANITGSGRADLIVQNSKGLLDLYINGGNQTGKGITWTECKTIAIPPSGFLRFADIDGDGRSDYVVEDAQGRLTGYLSNYTSGCSLAWTVIDGGRPDLIDAGTTQTDIHIQLADFTGNGKADYLRVANSGGAVHLYPNAGGFHSANSPIGGFAAAVRLDDLDGDGVDDYIAVTNISGAAVHLNGGVGAGDSWTWQEQADGNVVLLGYPQASRAEVAFADMNADGYADYLFVNSTNGQLACYLNHGPTSTGGWQWDIAGPLAIGDDGIGSRVRLADFDGDGKADYIYIKEDGNITVWLDKGPYGDLHDWTPIKGGSFAALAAEASAEDTAFADIDGDGRADYCWIHPDTGALQVWYNTFDNNGIGWVAGGVINPGQGYLGRNIRLARIGSSGRYDYVALEEDSGAMKAWINDCANVIGSTPRPLGGACGKPPLPTQTTSEKAPQTPIIASVDDGGQTVIQGSNSVQVTLPPGVTAATTITVSNGDVMTWMSRGNTQAATITNSANITIIQGMNGEQSTLPTGISQTTMVTQANGQVITYNPTIPISTSTPEFTPVFTGFGVSTTTTTSTTPFFIIPFHTSVPAPTGSGSTQQIPCNLWFFSICIEWQDISIQGWGLNFPPLTVIPPGPPPGIQIPGIEIRTIGPLPKWPAITIGGDGVPTFTPTTKPDNCETQTGSICMTSTSYGVSAGTTTTTDVLSTCSAIVGCNPTDSSSQTTITSSTSGACPLVTAIPFTFYSDPITLTYTASGGAPAVTSTFIPPQTLLPTNTASSLPTATALNPSPVMCWSADQGHAAFTYDDYLNVTTAFCDAAFVLKAQGGVAEAIRDTPHGGVTAGVFWAPDQSGCSPKADFSTSSSDHGDMAYQTCLTAFEGLYQFNGVQNPAFDSTSSGGSYVYSSPDNGCIQYDLTNDGQPCAV